MTFDVEQLKKYPTQPGVYLMKDKRGEILYVGKAKNLRLRIRQYFSKGGDGRAMIPFLISQIDTIETMVVLSEKESLLLENNLIKQHKPKYNAQFKDDKSYIALKVTKHQWPRVDVVRYRGKPKADGQYFGPYSHAGSARATLDLLHRLYPLRQCSDQEFKRRTRPCILYDIKQCIAPCVGKCTKEEYKEYVTRTVRFLQGQDTEVVKMLNEEMHRYSDALEFEKAGAILETIKRIERSIEGQYVDKPLGFEGDVLGIYRKGDELVISQLFFRHGRLTGSHHFNLSKIVGEDEDLIRTFLLQHYEEKEKKPKEILIPIDISGEESLEEILSIRIKTAYRGEKKVLLKMAFANAEATFNKEKDEKVIRERTLIEMQERLHLTCLPENIECFDNSNLSGSEPVSVMVAYSHGEKDKSRYRKYKIKAAKASDDYGAMYEVLIRRYARAKEEGTLPDLIVLDGGKGHLNVALRVMRELNIITVNCISIAKEKGRHDKGVTLEQIFLPNGKDPVHLRRNSSVLFFLQQVRDEAHRFAITFQKKRRSKVLVKSELTQISGIGPVKQKNLLRHLGSLKKIQEASQDDLKAVPGISSSDAEKILKHFSKKQ
ncbi:MAG: excinuclease ABC subunit UvrC [Waddliaceae bacterium]